MIIDACSWDHPGADRYTGNVPAAIAAYGFPQATQQALVAAFEARQFSDRVEITRDQIRGEKSYDPAIRAMHFGSRGVICGTVTRAKWAAEHVERAVVFCAAGECLAWPSVCGNLFRITPRAATASTAPGKPGEERLPAFMSSGGAPLGAGPAPAPDVALVAAPLPTLAPTLSSVSLPAAPPVLALAAPGSFVEGVAPLALAAAPVPMAWPSLATLNPLAVGPQVVATPIALPEPGAWVSMLIGLAVLAGVVRRRVGGPVRDVRRAAP